VRKGTFTVFREVIRSPAKAEVVKMATAIAITGNVRNRSCLIILFIDIQGCR
jgi:hypothetical protein